MRPPPITWSRIMAVTIPTGAADLIRRRPGDRPNLPDAGRAKRALQRPASPTIREAPSGDRHTV